MRYGIVGKAVITIYERACTTRDTEYGLASTIADEGLYGMAVAVTGGAEHGFVPVRTCCGYTGFVKAEELVLVSEDQVKAWESSNLMVIGGFCVDIVSIPKVQGVGLLSLYRGALVQVTAFESEMEGWAKVCLLNGTVGYMRNQYLWKKEFSQAGVWTGQFPQRSIINEMAFRNAVVETANQYRGVQYRWGGRSSAGIDCSGLTSASYMLNGILIYRDAKIVEGYPVHEISMERMRKGDLLYFPGHIAMYVGEGRYIHSTGRVGSGGVVINSLNPADGDYRQDLMDSLYAVGSIF